jgi:hypothetical protein
VVDRDLVVRLAARLQRGTNWGRAVGAVGLSPGFADTQIPHPGNVLLTQLAPGTHRD